ncbi:MAG: low molecular weight phosphotyrosine protein phosphatase [Deltaproteobacteria bacterium]|nr:low molecular weight phosphotyrosine protein phosphatase [Deltaproteobacteria bacterium]
MARGVPPIRVCFVCLGNICRSPTAEGVFLHLLDGEQLEDRVVADSAGTAGYHVGERPDPRTLATARGRGFSLPGVGRQFQAGDFERFDYILAMDRSNHSVLERMAKSEAQRAKLHLFRDFDPASEPGSEVPDPYYGGEDGFENVFDICDAAARGLLRHLREQHDLT